MNYYNEHDPKAAAWLRELIRERCIPDGVVDERDIQLVQPGDLNGFIQCHFFAGIGGWSYALRLAGWPNSEPVWTGSCPCQPFSAAGKGLGTKDPRHLWPQFRRLIRKCRPAKVYGEQVASAAGREWLDGVCADLEALAYANCAADLCAAGVGAPHIRQRLFWMANTTNTHRRSGKRGKETRAWPESEWRRGLGICGAVVGMADSGLSSDECGGQSGESHGTDGQNEGETQQRERCRTDSGNSVTNGVRMGHSNEPGPQGQHLGGDGAGERIAGPSGLGHWDDFCLVPCIDGKSRRTKPGIFPLAHGVSNRVGLLRGAGNAIVPQIAAAFIKASIDARLDLEFEQS